MGLTGFPAHISSLRLMYSGPKHVGNDTPSKVVAACSAHKIVHRQAITGIQVSMVVLRTTPERRSSMAKVEHNSDARILVTVDAESQIMAGSNHP